MSAKFHLDNCIKSPLLGQELQPSEFEKLTGSHTYPQTSSFKSMTNKKARAQQLLSWATVWPQ